jgi:hypothetical protein
MPITCLLAARRLNSTKIHEFLHSGYFATPSMKSGLHPGVTAAVVIGGSRVVIHCRRSCIPLLMLALKTVFLSSLPRILSIPTARSVVDITWKLLLWNKVCKGAGIQKGDFGGSTSTAQD